MADLFSMRTTAQRELEGQMPIPVITLPDYCLTLQEAFLFLFFCTVQMDKTPWKQNKKPP